MSDVNSQEDFMSDLLSSEFDPDGQTDMDLAIRNLKNIKSQNQQVKNKFILNEVSKEVSILDPAPATKIVAEQQVLRVKNRKNQY